MRAANRSRFAPRIGHARNRDGNHDGNDGRQVDHARVPGGRVRRLELAESHHRAAHAALAYPDELGVRNVHETTVPSLIRWP